MASFKKINCSYEKFLKDVNYDKESADEHHILQILEKYKALFAYPGLKFLPVFYVAEFSKFGYQVFSGGMQQMTGWCCEEWFDGGLGMLFHNFHKDDFKMYNEKIFPLDFAFLQEMPQETHEQYLFSNTYRMKDRSGNYIQVFQRGCYITCPETKQPQYFIGMAMNVSSWKTDCRMVRVVEKMQYTDYRNAAKVQADYFYPDEEHTLFSKKEKEVLLFMSDGLSIKQIAEKMKLAETTIITHRKSMMEKSNTKNSVELIAFSIRKHII